MLAGFKRCRGVASVAVVTSGHHDRVYTGIAKQLAGIGGGLAEPVAPGQRLGVGASASADAFEAQARERREIRHEHGLRVVAGTDLPESYRAARLVAPKSQRARPQFERASLGLGVLEDDPYRLTQLTARDLVKYRDRFREREPVGDEPRYGELALRDQIEKSLHVSVGRPAYVADWVVLATREIVGLVDAGPHRAAEQEVNLLAKPGTPVQLDRGVAEANHPAAVAHQRGGQLDWTEILGRHG